VPEPTRVRVPSPDETVDAVDGLTLEDRATLRAAHFERVAKYAGQGFRMDVTPAHLTDAALLLRALVRLAQSSQGGA
jgi:hypothetical protein